MDLIQTLIAVKKDNLDFLTAFEEWTIWDRLNEKTPIDLKNPIPWAQKKFPTLLMIMHGDLAALLCSELLVRSIRVFSEEKARAWQGQVDDVIKSLKPKQIEILKSMLCSILYRSLNEYSLDLKPFAIFEDGTFLLIITKWQNTYTFYTGTYKKNFEQFGKLEPIVSGPFVLSVYSSVGNNAYPIGTWNEKQVCFPDSSHIQVGETIYELTKKEQFDLAFTRPNPLQFAAQIENLLKEKV